MTGWRIADVQDQPGDPFLCERCRAVRTRHVHVVRHDDASLACCRGCALKLTADPERDRRRTELLMREWQASANGNPQVEEDGCIIGIFRTKHSEKWRPYVMRNDKFHHDREAGSFASQEDAMAAAVDLFLKLEVGEVQRLSP